MGKIQPGETVLDEHGRPTTVTGVSGVEIRSTYKVGFSCPDGNKGEIVADLDHLWQVLPWNDYPRVITTADMRNSFRMASGQPRYAIVSMESKAGYFTVTSVEPHLSLAVKCISVDSPSRLYLAGESRIPTHNSQTSAALAIKTALLSRTKTLILSRTLRQSSELFRDKITPMYRALGSPLKSRKPPSALGMELSNGSRMVCLPGNENSIQGYSGIDLLIVDEGSRVPDNLYKAVRPFLAVSDGRLVVLSTPFGKRGWFYEAWFGTMTGGDGDVDPRDCLRRRDGWERHWAVASDCPRITAGFLREERNEMGERWYGQEYKNDFSDPVGSVFSHADIFAAVSDDVTPMFPGMDVGV